MHFFFLNKSKTEVTKCTKFESYYTNRVLDETDFEHRNFDAQTIELLRDELRIILDKWIVYMLTKTKSNKKLKNLQIIVNLNKLEETRDTKFSGINIIFHLIVINFSIHFVF